MSSPFIPIKKADLAWRDDLPFSILYEEFYSSAEGGIKQSRHVFIDGNDLVDRWIALPKDNPAHFNIAETSFGTGLNFLLTWHLWKQFAPESAYLHYISCEKHPLKINELKRTLSLWPELAEQARQLIAAYPVLTPGYHQLTFDNGRVCLTLMLGDAFECFEQLLNCGESKLEAKIRTTFIDAWYLDGFSPEKNESMWSDSFFKIIAMLSKKNSTLATYTVAASAQSMLQEIGFIVEQRKGFDPKRDMLSAIFTEPVACRLRKIHTPWHVSYPQKEVNKSAIIIGAGLSGCFTAYYLAKRGWKVTLIDEADSVAKGGSGNQQAILFPKLSAYKSPLTQFMLCAFLYASKVYKKLLEQSDLGELNGSVLLAYNERELKAQQSLMDWLFHYPELGQLVDKKRVSELTGLSLDHEGLFIPLSGWIDSPALCRRLISSDAISLITNQKVTSLVFENEQWVVGNICAPVLILANSYQVNSFKEAQHLPVKSIRGQMTTIQATDSSIQLIRPICAEAHVLPAINGMHNLGATYEQGIAEALIHSTDDAVNLDKLNKMTKDVTWSKQVMNHWAGVRASAPDYLPLVGQLPKQAEFLMEFSGLESNSNRWIPQPGPYCQGLYICAGFGSRGLTTIPLCAEWLAATINNEISCLPRNLVQALSPSRFLRKDIVQRSIFTK